MTDRQHQLTTTAIDITNILFKYYDSNLTDL